MAERLLRQRLEGRPPAAGGGAHVHSAGILAGGHPVTTETGEVMDDWGIDASDHRSRQLTAELVAGADLVVGMERRHVAEACVLDPGAWGRSFTLKELVRRGEGVGPRPPGQSVAAWLASVHEGRARIDLLGASEADDVADPVVYFRVGYKQTAAEIDGLVDRVDRLVWPDAFRGGGAP